ncbi:MAG: Type 1 glutamine amidotransferase-like domain-containing protein [Ilumatobacter sp.]|uniref:Type 1 glutamine amidotransferase-like domain-containing protein n=1 Tax=Ilumatobacter sp. TaxID=1967498 RepID=UPI003297FC70
MLAIIGSGEYLAGMTAVDRDLLDLFDSPARVVCLPTAAGTEGDPMIDDWMHRGVAHFTALGADAAPVRVWDRTSADDVGLAEQVGAADLVYLSGGKPTHLFDSLNGSVVWQAILDVIGRGGLLVGCSAGAMIQGEVFAGFPRSHQGFGLWPGAHIVPHFDEIPTAVVSAMRLALGREHTLVGVDRNTAFLHADDTYRVIGERVTIWTRDDKVEFGPGEVPAGAMPS